MVVAGLKSKDYKERGPGVETWDFWSEKEETGSGMGPQAIKGGPASAHTGKYKFQESITEWEQAGSSGTRARSPIRQNQYQKTFVFSESGRKLEPRPGKDDNKQGCVQPAASNRPLSAKWSSCDSKNIIDVTANNYAFWEKERLTNLRWKATKRDKRRGCTLDRKNLLLPGCQCARDAWHE